MILPNFARETVWRAASTLAIWAHIPIQLYWCWTQGIRYRRGWRLCGKPLFRQRSGGVIHIGDRFTAHSRSEGNSIGVFQPVMITAWGAGSIVEIGDDVGVSGCSITAVKRIHIGNRVMIGAGALILDTDAHPLDPQERFHGGVAEREAITIEDDVFIGARAIVMKGTHLGRGAVVGAGAVVAKDVPPFCIVVGNPGRIVGKLPGYEKSGEP
jgi:acetyltransferase-like isoleucine patch superfamily enzyme